MYRGRRQRFGRPGGGYSNRGRVGNVDRYNYQAKKNKPTQNDSNIQDKEKRSVTITVVNDEKADEKKAPLIENKNSKNENKVIPTASNDEKTTPATNFTMKSKPSSLLDSLNAVDAANLPTRTILNPDAIKSRQQQQNKDNRDLSPATSQQPTNDGVVIVAEKKHHVNANHHQKKQVYHPKYNPLDSTSDESSSLSVNIEGIEFIFPAESSQRERKFTQRCRLFVGNIPQTMNETILQKLFERFGEVNECFINYQRSFGFVRLDTRAHAQLARNTIDGAYIKNNPSKPMRVRFASQGSAVKVTRIPKHVTNELLKQAFSQFGEIERAVVIVNDRGSTIGEGIVEFARKGSATAALKTINDGVFLLTADISPICVEPFQGQDGEEGFPESNVYRNAEFEKARSKEPRLVERGSFEYDLGLRRKECYEYEKRRKEELEREFDEAKLKLEFDMEGAYEEFQANKLRQELAQRQEQLKRLDEQRLVREQQRQEEFERRRRATAHPFATTATHGQQQQQQRDGLRSTTDDMHYNQQQRHRQQGSFEGVRHQHERQEYSFETCRGGEQQATQQQPGPGRFIPPPPTHLQIQQQRRDVDRRQQHTNEMQQRQRDRYHPYTNEHQQQQSRQQGDDAGVNELQLEELRRIQAEAVRAGIPLGAGAGGENDGRNVIPPPLLEDTGNQGNGSVSGSIGSFGSNDRGGWHPPPSSQHTGGTGERHPHPPVTYDRYGNLIHDDKFAVSTDGGGDINGGGRPLPSSGSHQQRRGRRADVRYVGDYRSSSYRGNDDYGNRHQHHHGDWQRRSSQQQQHDWKEHQQRHQGGFGSGSVSHKRPYQHHHHHQQQQHTISSSNETSPHQQYHTVAGREGTAGTSESRDEALRKNDDETSSHQVTSTEEGLAASSGLQSNVSSTPLDSVAITSSYLTPPSSKIGDSTNVASSVAAAKLFDASPKIKNIVRDLISGAAASRGGGSGHRDGEASGDGDDRQALSRDDSHDGPSGEKRSRRC